jgi:hypothetical protein
MAKIVEAERKRDPVSASRELDAKFISIASGHLFDASAIDAAVWDTMPAKTPGMVVTAGCDLGFSHDSSALVIACQVGSVRYVVDVLEMVPEPGKPLSFGTVMESFAERAKFWGADGIVADGHYREAVLEYLNRYDLGFIPAPAGMKGKTTTYSFVKSLIHGGNVRIPDHERLVQQLKEVEVRPSSGGALSISSPTWRSGGHGDIVSALVLALYRLGGYDVEDRPVTRAERDKRAEDEAIDRRIAAVEKKKDGDWWETERADLDKWFL